MVSPKSTLPQSIFCCLLVKATFIQPFAPVIVPYYPKYTSYCATFTDILFTMPSSSELSVADFATMENPETDRWPTA